MGTSTTEDRSEIAFFDVETTVPTRSGQGFSILEFGAILVCPRTLLELKSYSTLVRPADPSQITSLSVRSNGITRDKVECASFFVDIADKVYDILHGRIWAGHNIIRFDCARIREAFDKIGRPAPAPKGIIDSLTLLTQRFGRRAGDMKMATLATYFGIGKQSHRSLDDVRMNLEVLKYCATVLFLESSLPDVLMANNSVSPSRARGSCSKSKSSSEGVGENLISSSPTSQETGEQNPILSLVTHSAAEVSNLVATDTTHQDPFDMHTLSDEIATEVLQSNANIGEQHGPDSPNMSSIAASPEGCSGFAGFLEPDEVSLTSLSACLVPWFHGSQKIELMYKDVALQLFCSHLRVRFGVSTKFVDNFGRPRLNFVVDASPSLCRVLDECDKIAQKFSVESGSKSKWWHVVIKFGKYNNPTIRVHIPIMFNGGNEQIMTEIYQRDCSGTTQKVVFSGLETTELINLIRPVKLVDVFFSFDSYDYQGSAGIRLVAKKLIIHSEE
ncbi:hypothetical protein SLA2020_174850 [Shorea laevis]